MVTIEDLTGIPEAERNVIIKYLDFLLGAGGKDVFSPIISSYNIFNQLLKTDSVITLSNIHETPDYEEDMLNDLVALGYPSEPVISNKRDKLAFFLWKHFYRTRDNKGDMLDLKLKNSMDNQIIPLEKYPLPLENYPGLDILRDSLVAEADGLEFNIEFKNKKDLLQITQLFTRKSGTKIYDSQGDEIYESQDEIAKRKPWRDAYETPMLIIGEGAVKYYKELPQFEKAMKIELLEGENEISFIIHNKLEILRALPCYPILKKLGFCEIPCLANKPFLIDVNMIR